MKSHKSHILKVFLSVAIPSILFFYSASQILASPIKMPIMEKNTTIEEEAPLKLNISPSQIICIDNTIDVKMNIEGVDTNFPVQVLLYNTIGNLVYRMDLSLNKTDIQFQFKPQTRITEGLYFVSILNGTNRVTRRMVVNAPE